MRCRILLGTIALAACGAPSSPAKSVPDAKGTLNTSADVAASAPGASSNDDIAKGTAAVKAEDWATARAAFEAAIKKNPKQADAYYYLGLAMDKTGDRVAAEKNYKEALLLAPDLDEAAENLTAIYIEAKRFDDAIMLARRTLERHSDNADMQLNLAVALSGKGYVNAATKAFDDAIKLSPNDARYYLAYAQHLTAAKKTSEAVAKLKQAQRVAGDDPVLLGTIGFELRTARAVPECIEAFDKAISFKDNADFRTNRALCKYAAKDKAAAVVDLKVALHKEPNFAPAHYWLGSWLHADGRFADAIAEYDAYLKAEPSGPMAKAAEAKRQLAKEKKKPPRK
ncbi:MAG: tetratricopeptide repeat protein [Polyangiaceae bacterium]|nr:tetratricopeptide repeat protein [Polyangiaceae bacterium]